MANENMGALFETLLMSGKYAIVRIDPDVGPISVASFRIGVSRDELEMILDALDRYRGDESMTDEKRFAISLRKRLFEVLAGRANTL